MKWLFALLLTLANDSWHVLRYPVDFIGEYKEAKYWERRDAQARRETWREMIDAIMEMPADYPKGNDYPRPYDDEMECCPATPPGVPPPPVTI